jgi:hypothetical protein
MKPTTRSKFAHKHHPLFAAVKDVYRSLQAIQCQPTAAARSRQLERVAAQLVIYVGEAIALPWLRARRLAGARAYVHRLDLVLEVLQMDEAIEEGDCERVSDQLSTFYDALEVFAHQAAELARQKRAAKSEPVAAGKRGMPAETQAPEPALDSEGAPPESDGASDGREHKEGEAGSLDAQGATDRQLGGTESEPAPDPTKPSSS